MIVLRQALQQRERSGPAIRSPCVRDDTIYNRDSLRLVGYLHTCNEDGHEFLDALRTDPEMPAGGLILDLELVPNLGVFAELATTDRGPEILKCARKPPLNPGPN